MYKQNVYDRISLRDYLHNCSMLQQSFITCSRNQPVSQEIIPNLGNPNQRPHPTHTKTNFRHLAEPQWQIILGGPPSSPPKGDFSSSPIIPFSKEVPPPLGMTGEGVSLGFMGMGADKGVPKSLGGREERDDDDEDDGGGRKIPALLGDLGGCLRGEGRRPCPSVRAPLTIHL